MDLERTIKFYEVKLNTMDSWTRVAEENHIQLTAHQIGQVAGIKTTIEEILIMLRGND